MAENKPVKIYLEHLEYPVVKVGDEEMEWEQKKFLLLEEREVEGHWCFISTSKTSSCKWCYATI